MGDGLRVATVDYSGTDAPDVTVYDVSLSADRPSPHGHSHHHTSGTQLSTLMSGAWGQVDVVAPVSRWHEVDGRRIQGWFLEAPRQRRQAGAAGRGDPRRPGHALRLVHVLGVAGPGRIRDQRLRLQSARIAGLRTGLLLRQLPRLGRRPHARRHGRRRYADRRRPGGWRPTGRDRRLVRRLPHLVDGGSQPSGSRPRSAAAASTT